jgi:hypothetical protein
MNVMDMQRFKLTDDEHTAIFNAYPERFARSAGSFRSSDIVVIALELGIVDRTERHAERLTERERTEIDIRVLLNTRDDRDTLTLWSEVIAAAIALEFVAVPGSGSARA